MTRSLRLKIPPQDVPAFTYLAGTAVRDLQAMSASLDSGPRLLRRSELWGKLSTVPEATREDVMRVLLAVATVIRRHDATRGELFDDIAAALDEQRSWTDESRRAFKEKRETLLPLLTHANLATLEKASSLHYEYANVVQSSRILTDVRPVFENEGEEPGNPVAAVISHTLEVIYSDGDRRGEMTLALDQGTLGALALQCERASRKAEKLQEVLAAGSRLETIIAGQDKDYG